MVNYQNPALILNDFIAFIKLNHVMAGIFIWETVFTAGFELDVLRGKRPYRWTIWIYLGTRYTLLLAFIFIFIDLDGPRIPCQSLIMLILALVYTAWAFASLIIVLRVIAIWNRNAIVSLISIGIWSGALALNIRHVTIIAGTVSYNPVVNTCITLHTHKGIVDNIGVLVVDVVLLLMTLIGLLRHANGTSIGIWKLLYQQCIIWLVAALIAEIPPLVFLILNLNDVWNEMLIMVGITILSVSASRMYRSLSDRGSFTEYVPSNPPQFLTNPSNLSAQFKGSNVSAPVHFASVTQSDGTRTPYGSPKLPSEDQIHLEFVPGKSITSLVHESTKDKANPAAYESV